MAVNNKKQQTKDPELLRALSILKLAKSPELKARRSLIDFVKYTMPNYQVDKMHLVIAQELDKISRGELKRLMVFAPPQHGKTELCSIRFPAYYLGKHPNDPIILASYSADRAEANSRQIRNIIIDDPFKQLYPGLSLSKSSRAVNRWALDGYKGQVLAAGTGGPLTGNPAKLAILDDPIQNWEDAQSPTKRDKAWEWYQGTFVTRLWEGAAIVFIMTRWHESDLAGRILQNSHETDPLYQWKVLRIPAISEDQHTRNANNAFIHIPADKDPLGRKANEPAAPRRFSLEELNRKLTSGELSATVWSAEYQQVPRPLEGARILRSWLDKFVPNAPEGKRIRYWDKAATEDKSEAATAGVLVCFGKDGLLYIEDVVQGWWTPYEREQKILNTAARDSAIYGGPYVVKIWVEQEPGSGGKESAENTVKNLMGYSIYVDKPTTNKDARMEPFAAQAQAGKVRIVHGTWNHEYVEEIISVPNGIRRDQADATAGAVSKLIIKGDNIGHIPYAGLWGYKGERGYGGWKR